LEPRLPDWRLLSLALFLLEVAMPAATASR
jgi:hypothetical protein